LRLAFLWLQSSSDHKALIDHGLRKGGRTDNRPLAHI
jgi:hypothetical protein